MNAYWLGLFQERWVDAFNTTTTTNNNNNNDNNNNNKSLFLWHQSNNSGALGTLNAKMLAEVHVSKLQSKACRS